MLRPLWLLVFAYLGLSLLLRSVLWLQFGVASNVDMLSVPAILTLGLVNDLVEVVFLFSPLALYLACVPRRWHQRPTGRRVLIGIFWLMLFGMLFLCGIEYFFFEEFDSRFNLVAVDYLIYPTEVIGDIRAEYPVASLSVILALIAGLLTWLARPSLLHWTEKTKVSRRSRAQLAALFVLLTGAASLWWPADRLSFSDNRVANELTANGSASFFSAFKTNHIDYNAFYRRGDPAAMRALLAADLIRGGGEFVDPTQADLTRRFAARKDGLGKLNVVVIAEESLGAEYVGAYGDPRKLTPEFDALAQQGLLFTRAYSTGTRTVRGLEALSASFPPIPSESILKRPGNEDIATWGKVMQRMGYRTSFIYGGYSAFDNMNQYFSRNGFEISDRSDIKKPLFANTWGVSDGDLVHHAIQYFDKQAEGDKPFFSIVLSTSNHKPFTFPDGIPGVKPKGGGRVAGARYADHAIGAFFREASNQPWFSRTIFVVVADHGARAYGKANIPLYSYEIPLLIIAPGLKPGRVDILTSQIDVAPTILGLIGQPYEAPFFGQDVLHWPADQSRTLLFNHNHNVALLQNGRLCVLGLHQNSHCETYQRAAGAPGSQTTYFTRLEQDDPALVDLATAYYQTAYDLYQSRGYR